ncbi:MAG: sugar ABC transporter permease [Chloroflexi bacterium]|nr:sugar ABC transporter permease [Chloroflexota bacterium]
MNQRWLPKDWIATLVLLVTAAFFILVLWQSIAQTFAWSLYKKQYFQMEWVGLKNYKTLFTDDPVFLKSLQVSFHYTLMVVPSVMILGLILAVLVNSITNLTLRGFFTAAYFIAYVVPLVAVAVVWRYMFEPSRIGLFNAALDLIGLGPVRWLRSTKTALPSLAIVGVWKNIGYAMVIYLAGLQAIPHVYYEAAMIDGASRWRRFLNITLPLLMPTILFVLIINTIGTLMMFTETYVMTGGQGAVSEPRGGPNYATHTVVYNIYETAFSYGKEGYASAMSVIFFVIIVLITLLQFRFVPSSLEE